MRGNTHVATKLYQSSRQNNPAIVDATINLTRISHKVLAKSRPPWHN
jgi:hypothetical protein